MKVDEFLRGRPCLEELDGYLMGLRIQIEHRDAFPMPPNYETIDAEVLGPIETYRSLLMKGKEVPAPSRMERMWIYKRGSRPKKKRVPHEHNHKDSPSSNDQQGREARRPPLDLNKRSP